MSDTWEAKRKRKQRERKRLGLTYLGVVVDAKGLATLLAHEGYANNARGLSKYLEGEDSAVSHFRGYIVSQLSQPPFRCPTFVPAWDSLGTSGTPGTLGTSGTPGTDGT